MTMCSRAAAFVLAALMTTATAGAQSPSYNWQGLYLGVHGAALSADTAYENPATPEQRLRGALIGLQGGYNIQNGRIVIGIEGDVSFGDVDEFIRDGNYLTQSGNLGMTGTLRGRIGYAFDNVLPYLTAGAMWARLEQGSACPAGALFGVCALTGPFNVSSSETFFGWAFGGGVEWGISRHWSVKGEALFGRFRDETYTGTVPVVGTVSTPVELNLDYIARLGLNYRF